MAIDGIGPGGGISGKFPVKSEKPQDGEKISSFGDLLAQETQKPNTVTARDISHQKIEPLLGKALAIATRADQLNVPSNSRAFDQLVTDEITRSNTPGLRI